MINVLHITEELSAVGGTPRKMLCLVRYAGADVRHEFLSMRPGSLDAEFGVHATTTCIGSTSARTLTLAALQMLRTRRFDVVSTHFTRAFVCGYLACRIADVPIVHNEHGLVSDAPAYRVTARAGSLLRRRWLPKADAVICNSRYTATSVHQKYSVPLERLNVIHPPVESRIGDADRVTRCPYVCGEIVIGHVGGLIPVRDQRTLIASIAELRDRGVSARLIMIGDGPLRGELENAARAMGVADRVEFQGYASDLRPFFERVHVYVNTAIGEGFGIAVVEAMLAGTPVVLADAGSHRELTRDGEVGGLFAPGSASGLADRIVELMRDAPGRVRLADAARLWAKQTFEPHRYATAYENVMRLAANRPPVPDPPWNVAPRSWS